ncbi:RAD50-interacting protein 1-like [Tubulanus polymorphus]|uniref:RAD50-interacting protein 1-like n=1 Tax=Tubulanus polymorphus TaxID=672921 RepID=UPI003DA32982
MKMVSTQQFVVDFINEHFNTADVKTLLKARTLFEEVKAQKDELEEKMRIVSSEAPSIVDHAIHDADRALAKAKELNTKQEVTCKNIVKHIPQCKRTLEKLIHLSSQIEELERYVSYLEWISHIESLSSNIQTSLIIGSVERSVSGFAAMTDVVTNLQNTKCSNLLQFGKDTIMFWYKILRDKLVSEFEEILKAMRWPFTTTTVQNLPAVQTPNSEMTDRMETLFCQLVKLQLPDCLAPDSRINHPVLSDLPGWRPILLPIQLLLNPLKKRFRFHFYGNKQTNSLDKPEWFFTQVLGWIRDHRVFLIDTIQPMLSLAGIGYIDALSEFSRGLVLLVMEKMVTDMDDLMYDEHLFSHMIDEALMFEKDLRGSYEYPTNQPGCLHVLTEPRPFEKWLLIEKKFALEKMDAMLESQTAWESQYRDVGEVDDMKVPECGESFMTLMLTITDRYKLLPDAHHRLQFLNLQLHLLDDFRIRLLQIMKEGANDPTNKCFCAILNTNHYITEVLREWNELLFFLQLQYHRHKECMSDDDVDEEDDDFKSIASPTTPLSPSRSLLSRSTSASSKMTDSILESVQGTVFDEPLQLYEHMKTDMMKNIVGYVTTDVKARSRPYRKERWIALPSQKDYISLGLSVSACEMFMVLKDWLHTIEQLLSLPLFKVFWQACAESLNKFIYKEVILSNYFNEGGAVQLQYDMTRNLFPMFGQYTTKPENYFRDVKESCMVLNLKRGTAIMLKELIYNALHVLDTTLPPQDPIAALNDVAIFKLSPEDVELVLSLRTDLNIGS